MNTDDDKGSRQYFEELADLNPAMFSEEYDHYNDEDFSEATDEN